MMRFNTMIPFERNICRQCHVGCAIVILACCLFLSPAETLPHLPPSNKTNDSTLPGSFSQKYGEVCYTDACKTTARHILQSLKSNVDPCDNFYEYACGNYLSEIKVPSNLFKLSESILSGIDFYTQLNETLRLTRTDDEKSYKIVRSLYRTCMDTEKIETSGVKELTAMMNKIGGWPVIYGNAWNESGWDWLETMSKLRQFGFWPHYLIEFEYDSDSNNITFMSPEQKLSREALLKGKENSDVRALLDYMTVVVKEFGAKGGHVNDDLAQILYFEQQLANISKPCEPIDVPKNTSKSNMKLSNESDEKIAAKMNVSTWSKNFTTISWHEYIKKIIPESVKAENDGIINVLCPEYFQGLDSLLERTPKRVIANYLMWKVVNDSSTALNKNIRDAESIFLDALGENTYDRWLTCVDNVKHISPAIDYVFVQEYLDREARDKVIDIYRHLKENLLEILKNITWIDATTKENFLKNNTPPSSYIAYSDDLLDSKKVDDFYDGLNLSDEVSYLENRLRFKKFAYENLTREFTSDTNWSYLYENHDLPNAFFAVKKNALFLKARAIQKFYYDKNRPAYANYGSIGMTIGHEIAHAYGPDKDSSGTNDNRFQINNSTRQLYEKRIECIVKQYSNYTIKEIGSKLDGLQTVDENFADIVGTKIAYAAYDQFVNKHGEEQKLPGIEKTSRQMFWLTFANSICEKYDLKNSYDKAVEFIKTDEHAPYELRVLGMLSANPNFAADYNCPVGSKMNPVDRCDLF